MRATLPVSTVDVDAQLVVAQSSEGRVNGGQVGGEIVARSEQRLVDEPSDQLRR